MTWDCIRHALYVCMHACMDVCTHKRILYLYINSIYLERETERVKKKNIIEPPQIEVSGAFEGVWMELISGFRGTKKGFLGAEGGFEELGSVPRSGFGAFGLGFRV